MNWRLLTQRHLEHLHTLGRSRSTLAASRRWLARFIAFCERRCRRPTDVLAEDLGAFRRVLEAQDRYSESSVAQAMTRVRVLLRWAAEHHYLLLDPSKDLVVRRPARLCRHVPRPEELESLFTVPSSVTALGLRDRAILELFYGTGVRREECRGLDLRDVDLRALKLRVRQGKGGHERFLPVGASLRNSLLLYLEVARPELAARAPGNSALLLNRYGHRLEDFNLTKLVREHGERVGLRVTPHLLRHAFAVHLMEGGAKLRHIQEMLGHADVRTTEIYLTVRPAELHRVYRRTHPRASRKDPSR